MPQLKQTINNKPVLVSDVLQDYTIYHRNSTFVAYIAVKGDNSLFIQFCNGTCFIYPDLPVDLIKSALEAESVGKWFHANLKGQYEGEQLESDCIQLDILEDEDDDEDDQYDPFENNYDEGWDSL